MREFISYWRCPFAKCRQKSVVEWNGNDAGNMGKKWPFCERHCVPMIMTSNSVDGCLDVNGWEKEKWLRK